MKPKTELKVLKQIEGAMNDTSSHLRKVRAFVWGSRILGWVGLVAAVLLVRQSVVSPSVGIVIAAFSGIGVGLAIYGQMALTQWPALKPHVNEESVKNRIKEIEI